MASVLQSQVLEFVSDQVTFLTAPIVTSIARVRFLASVNATMHHEGIGLIETFVALITVIRFLACVASNMSSEGLRVRSIVRAVRTLKNTLRPSRIINATTHIPHYYVTRRVLRAVVQLLEEQVVGEGMLLKSRRHRVVVSCGEVPKSEQRSRDGAGL